MTETLEDFRRDIDRIDNQLIGLLAERFVVTEKVGQYKKLHGLPSVDPAREAILFAKIRDLAFEQGISPDMTQKIFRHIVDDVVRRHGEIRESSAA